MKESENALQEIYRQRSETEKRLLYTGHKKQPQSPKLREEITESKKLLRYTEAFLATA